VTAQIWRTFQAKSPLAKPCPPTNRDTALARQPIVATKLCPP
jgi:hypothetical protein